MQKITSTSLSDLDLGYRLQMAYKDIGVSMYNHIYKFKEFFPRRYCNQESLKFVKKVYDFYMSLNEFEKMMFVCDCLEKGRHSKYWYEPYKNARTYYAIRRKFYEKVKKHFYN